eukprot:gene27508-35512_t
MALYGLQGMNSSISGVESVLAALVPKINQSKAEFSAQNIGMSLYGMQGMKSSSITADNVLLALAPKITHSKAELSAQNIG